MPKVEVQEACFINGEPYAIGDLATVDGGTAKLLILSGRAVTAKEEEAPRQRVKAQPTTTIKKED